MFHFTATFGIVREELSSKETAVLAKRRVLVADANATSQRIMTQMLLNWEMEPMVVGTIREAIHLYAESVATQRTFEYVLLVSQIPEDLEGLSLALFTESLTVAKDTTIIMALSPTATKRGTRRNH